MSLPELKNWDDTKSALHQAMQVLRSTRLLGVDPMPNQLEYSTLPTPYGATTGQMSFGGALEFDYSQAVINYVIAGKTVFSVALTGHTQTTLFDAVFAEFKKAGRDFEPNREKVTGTTALKIDKAQASAYAEVQWRMYETLARLKTRMFGAQSPIALWPHGWDLSTLWFMDGMDEHKDPQVCFGFSPGTPDVGQPYIYFYAWPVPQDIDKQIPEVFTWNTDWGTPGGIITYDKFRDMDDPETFIVETLDCIYRMASQMLKEKAAG